MRTIPYSVLDLAWVPDNLTPQQSLHQTPKLAAVVEQAGYHRYWVAEHHNMPGTACSATSLVLGFAGANTTRIRLGSGGVMLPNHAPLVVAEQFGTLEAFYPGRIDLGLGRAPGTDGATVRALRRDPYRSADNFVEDVEELRSYFAPDAWQQKIIANPAAGRQVPLWILGSSTYGAQVAAMLGLPYAFASHFAPQALEEALDIYRRNFQPSEQLTEPYVMLVMNVFCAKTEELAVLQSTTLAQMSYHLARGNPRQLLPPNKDFMQQIAPHERQQIEQFRRYSAVGTPAQVQARIQAVAHQFEADEMMLAAAYYNFDERLEAYQLIAADNPHMQNMVD